MATYKSMSAHIFETALAGKEPIKELLSMAADFIKKGENRNLRDIDIMLIDRYIDYLRYGMKDDLNSFLYAILSLVDSSTGEKLKESEDGKRYFYRWEHFEDLCTTAIENYDPVFTARLVSSRKHGRELIEILSAHRDGIRHNSLSKMLGMTEQHLSKLLREFEEDGLVIRERKNKVSMIRLGFAGRAYMAEKGETFEEKLEDRADITGHRFTEEENPVFYSEKSPKELLMAA
jgi:DNA-binding HxlR family transcriptional regulator